MKDIDSDHELLSHSFTLVISRGPRAAKLALIPDMRQFASASATDSDYHDDDRPRAGGFRPLVTTVRLAVAAGSESRAQLGVPAPGRCPGSESE